MTTTAATIAATMMIGFGFGLRSQTGGTRRTSQAVPRALGAAPKRRFVSAVGAHSRVQRELNRHLVSDMRTSVPWKGRMSTKGVSRRF